ncbi:MAG: N-acyl-D-amino-acid deacylase family protein [Phyllobacterium sp.]
MPSTTHDLVLRNALIIDGTGKPGFLGDIGIKGERISFIGGAGTLSGDETLDVGGRAVSPGFIDVHTHDDRLVLDDPAMGPKVSQGVSTVIVGNCGISLSPLLLRGKEPPQPLNLLGGTGDFRFGRMADYIKAVDAASPAVNVAALVGHSSLRIAVMDDLERPATEAEIEQMRQTLALALEDGAIGLSSGLYYPPARAAEMDEVVPLAREVALVGGVYTTHMRDEDDFVMESLEETFETGRRADVPVIVSHHKCAGRKNWGRSVQTLQAIETAAARQEVGVDVYPYAACSTILLPEWVDESIRVMVTWSTTYPEMAARDLADIAAEWGVSQKEASARLMPAGAVYFDMHEDDVRRILANPLVMIGSDGIPHDQHPHPRLWGTFPRVLGHYSRDVGLFSLEEAVRKMTSLPAAKFRLKDRGQVAAGCFADLVLFDPASIIDVATFEKPIAAAAGIETVFVNGKIAYSNVDENVSGKSGHFIRRQA